MNKLRLKIVTPEKVVLSEEIKQISLNTTMGQITILPHHIPLVGQLVAGEIIVKMNGENEDFMAVSGGFVEVLPEEIIILADSAEYADEIDEARADEAKKKAEELIKEKIANSEDYALVAAKLQKELVRLKVVRRRRKNRIK